jgi:hyperosmotically inducible periplasmic protein
MKRFAYALSTAALAAAVACSQSDPGVTTAVKSKLAADDTVRAYQIDVDTNDRVVTLSGTVETAAEKDHAIMIARQTDGVRDVVDQMTVNPETAPTTGDLAGEAADRSAAVASDAAVTAAVKSKFLADTAVSGLKIDVDTSGGVVTLNGAVATKAEADRATSLARETVGVTRVVNNLRVGG